MLYIDILGLSGLNNLLRGDTGLMEGHDEFWHFSKSLFIWNIEVIELSMAGFRQAAQFWCFRIRSFHIRSFSDLIWLLKRQISEKVSELFCLSKCSLSIKCLRPGSDPRCPCYIFQKAKPILKSTPLILLWDTWYGPQAK